MREICIGIFHEDYQYGKRLMEYLNHQKEFPMTARFSSDEESFFKQEKQGEFQCLVLAEETDYQGDSPVCRIRSGDEAGGNYSQSAREIAANIYSCLNVKLDQAPNIVGVYSPVGRPEASIFARRFSREHDWIYFCMQPYSSVVDLADLTELLLFRIRERDEQIADYFLKHQKEFREFRGYAGADCYLDYRELSLEDYQWFFERLREGNIQVVFDIGAAMPPYLPFLGLFDKIYLPLTNWDFISCEYRVFLREMQRHNIWMQTTWEEVMLNPEEEIDPERLAEALGSGRRN